MSQPPAPDRNDHINDRRRPEESSAFGGGQVSGIGGRAAGRWAGHIDKTFPTEERQRLWAEAIAAGHIDDSLVNRVRFHAATLQAKTRPEAAVTGWFIRRVELGDWNYLAPRFVETAIDRLGIRDRLTIDEFREIRTAKAQLAR